MRILILGADGMLGHQLVASLRGRHEVIGTLRRGEDDYRAIGDFLPSSRWHELDASNVSSLADAIGVIAPEVVINAIGIVKQSTESKNVISSLEVNALFPHLLAEVCREVGARLVHLSTDCVFSGARGKYEEADFADANDLYGRTKFLGEVSETGALTLRTSIIGLELSRKQSLIEWFLAQKGPIRGYRRAIYSGFTTMEMARIIERVLLHSPEATGVYHVSSDPIDKYTLLCRLRDRLKRAIEIIADDDFSCDRSLRSERFRRDFSYQPPEWDAMLDELAQQIEARRK